MHMFRTSKTTAKSTTMRASAHRTKKRFWMAAAVMLVLATLPGSALAACWVTNGTTPPSIVHYGGGTVNLTNLDSITPGTVVWTSSVVNPSFEVDISCNTGNGGGIVNAPGGANYPGDDTLFPTGVAGFYYRLFHATDNNSLRAFANYPLPNGAGSYQATISTQVEIVWMGPDKPTSGTTIQGSLGQWDLEYCTPYDSNRYWSSCQPGTTHQGHLESFTTGPITFIVPTCKIPNKDITVQLPPVATTDFTNIGTHLAQTPFHISLTNCSSGLGVSVTVDSSDKVTGLTGVISGTASTTTGVGVQLLKGDGSTPITFGPAGAYSTGATTGSTYQINMYARYYQLAGTVTPGSVNATATYTVTYQ